MKLLEQRIREDGQVLPGDVLKVDSFLNHQVDPELMAEVGKEFQRHFADQPVTKILTVESSGIAPAVFTGYAFKVPVVFARKHKSVTLKEDMFTSVVYSYTKKVSNHIAIARKFLSADDKVLIIDDFLANGQAVEGLIDIINQAGAQLLGVGIVIEKTFQKGRQLLDKRDIPVYSLARIKEFKDGQVVFTEEQENPDGAEA
ncbi:xanthine phosphoribosyltransferase [Schleiferilactobacillus harbinensis]|jgi:xanthine phosphoribosyltransferase|uniref:Xanthine phosphoribosyltransferase n=1 Tax=Schleiferilactobacillus harbinensis TaxID=304207 RepID=A0A510TUM3_9LACO|nr:xanthine phosphoribosyltransferase [Schleiferilactobacillus harbinensis]HAY52644.1 xanthine phosphoribosyltransferase [Lactobacillus sp.]MCI1850377.1 xanthine phosphoribosyltransferase [Schleiferilactobacillus harbinensis]MCT2909414.1 xanthine phosphoribosyltransferase [Schleiferilactobacillus harbinensis]QEU46976.1 xanthine phosphoribosyltransferase [Schleiferilactobacillus harbinensis]QFR24019.1 xanthine phosphoribosyltransferase [Schleiferilactobacillus harbinensis]